MKFEDDIKTIQKARNDIKAALAEHGITAGDNITTYADLIKQIPSYNEG